MTISLGKAFKVVMLGATGAVGNHAALTLVQLSGMQRLTLLGRRPADSITGSFVTQHAVDVLNRPVTSRCYLATLAPFARWA